MIILLNRCGQLANRLFMFAKFIALSQKYNLKVMNWAFFEYQRHFKQSNLDLFCRYPKKNFKFVRNKKVTDLLYFLCFQSFRFLNKINIFKKRLMIIDLSSSDMALDAANCDPNFLWTAKNGLVVILHGWRDVFTNLDKPEASAVKDYFVIEDEHKNEIEKVIDDARKLGQILVGVHIRHGDYKWFCGGKYFYSTSVYKNLMERFKNINPDKSIVFLICSNELQILSDFAGFNCVLASGHRVEDLYALSYCDYLIGPPSTYSMWASFYGQKPLYIVENTKHDFELTDFKIFCEY
ncbi:MAG: hypothetical protein US49_C0006G0113 [candidate division TM6 bacterium GW2011_GWF2_37_49]|nr:MAG: hypothetical protein US49_C0006G0113 [candidate division TM6 bacterium GW2011_GWF2_37_49]